MACCLMAPSHYPNQCWLLISEILWHFGENWPCYNATILYQSWFKACAQPMKMAIQSNAISHWLGANLQSTLLYCSFPSFLLPKLIAKIIQIHTLESSLSPCINIHAVLFLLFRLQRCWITKCLWSQLCWLAFRSSWRTIPTHSTWLRPMGSIWWPYWSCHKPAWLWRMLRHCRWDRKIRKIFKKTYTL